jgi:DNA-directed RNA polymerase subunit RPC12/RpoP
MDGPLKPSYSCSVCNWAGEEGRFQVKVLSIMYRPKYENIQAFKQVKCPRCSNLVTIIFETLDCSAKKNN